MSSGSATTTGPGRPLTATWASSRATGAARGSCALIYRDTFAFTGDHVWANRDERHLGAGRDVSWYSWPEQQRSMIRLAEHARLRKVRIVHASPSDVYGDPTEHPQNERYWGHVNPLGDTACYDEGKRCAETLFFDYGRQYELPIKVARIFNTYGPYMHPNDGRVVSNFVMQALRGEPITIYGDGSQTRSFCYVADLVEGLVRLMNSGDEVTGPINLGNPNELTVRDMAETVVRQCHSNSPVSFEALPADDPKQRQPDISKARELLGWQPAVPLAQGLPPTIEYFRRFVPSGR